MTLATYLQLAKFRRYVPDWIAAAAVFCYFYFVAEHARPFGRQFKLSDPTIQHPFATTERVLGPLCLVLAAAVPALVMTVVTFAKHGHAKTHAWHVLQVSLLGAFLTISIDGLITDILKCWVGRPRPDFLERCGAPLALDPDAYYDMSVCTAPLGQGLLLDGMRSTPSGHLSISFSAFLFLSMWLFGQLQLLQRVGSQPMYLYVFAALPLLLAAYIALLRVQDYRHHFVDIITGGVLGCCVARVVYAKFFHPCTSDKSHEIVGDDEEAILPL